MVEATLISSSPIKGEPNKTRIKFSVRVNGIEAGVHEVDAAMPDDAIDLVSIAQHFAAQLSTGKPTEDAVAEPITIDTKIGEKDIGK